MQVLGLFWSGGIFENLLGVTSDEVLGGHGLAGDIRECDVLNLTSIGTSENTFVGVEEVSLDEGFAVDAREDGTVNVVRIGIHVAFGEIFADVFESRGTINLGFSVDRLGAEFIEVLDLGIIELVLFEDVVLLIGGVLNGGPEFLLD